MNKEFVESMKSSLISERDEILYLSKNGSDIDSEGDETDEIQASMISSLSKTIGTRYLKKLKDIEIALTKIHNNEFGICVDCEEEIGQARIKCNPCFETCISCAEAREIEEQKLKKILQK